jgi:putative nucleotidyltransferase with HDIG domain
MAKDLSMRTYVLTFEFADARFSTEQEVGMRKKKKTSWLNRLGLNDRYNIAFFLSSVIPLGVLVYLSYKYVFPSLKDTHQDSYAIWLSVLLYLLVFLSILAFFVSRAATVETVEKLRTNNEKLKNVFVISESLSREVYLDVLINSIVKRAVELTNASAGLVLTCNQETGNLEFQVTLGAGSVSRREVSPNTGVAGWVVRNRRVAVINDVSSDSRYNREQNILPDFDTGSILAVPLLGSGKVFGVVELLKKKNSPGFTDDDANLLKCLAGQTTIFIQNVNFREQQQNYFTHITEILLTSMEGTRQFWPGHLTNTARYANLIARQLDVTDADLKNIHYAALLHDIGFVKIKLGDRPSRQRIELHPVAGYEMIRPITLWKDVAPIIKHHHERYDGKGYPDGFSKKKIPLGARIVAVAESLEVITNPKSYRGETLDFKGALKEIKAYSGTQFDPAVVDALEKVIMSEQLS